MNTTLGTRFGLRLVMLEEAHTRAETVVATCRVQLEAARERVARARDDEVEAGVLYGELESQVWQRRQELAEVKADLASRPVCPGEECASEIGVVAVDER